jgi:hypothetical protein
VIAECLMQYGFHFLVLIREEASLKAGNQNSARTLQELSDLISTTQNTLEQYESDCKQRGLEIKETCSDTDKNRHNV